MKKSLFIIAMSLVATIGFAQGNSWDDKVNQWNAGIVIGYGTEISKPSFGIRGVYDIVNAFSVAGSFNYYLKDSEKAEYAGASAEASVKYWDINVDGHWNFLYDDSYKVYVLVGIGYIRSKVSVSGSYQGYEVMDGSTSDGFVTGNFGIGGQYNFSDKWGAAFEAKYQAYSGGGQFVPELSVMYRF